MIRINAKDWKAAGCPTKLRDVIDLGGYSGRAAGKRYPVAPKEERTAGGIPFHSKAEMARWRELCTMQQFGDVVYFHRQVPFDLAGIVYRCDFMILWPMPDGAVRVTYEDVKCKNWEARPDARAFKQHRAQVAQLYHVDVVPVIR